MQPRRCLLAIAIVLGGALTPRSAAAQVFLTQEQALELAFPGASIERRTAYLTAEQLAGARSFAGRSVPIQQAIVTYYVATVDGRPVGVAYFDAHRVRTLPEVLMVVVGTDGRVRRVEVLRFSEPPEYVAPGGWLEQFSGRGLDERLSLRRDIVNITGATLTAGAVTDAVRRVLALHRVIRPLEAR